METTEHTTMPRTHLKRSIVFPFLARAYINTGRGALSLRPAIGSAGNCADYLPREVFFGRFGFPAAFFSVCEIDFSRFFPATPGSFRRRSTEAA
jgi:hypothetical protein